MNTSQQITIRGVDDPTKQVLQAHAQKSGLSLNAYSLELLRRDAGTSQIKKTNGLERFSGTMPLDPKFEEALADQRRPTPDKWDSYGF